MTIPANSNPRPWATSSYSETAQTSPVELAELGEHKAQCSVKGGRLVALRCGATRLLGFVTARLVTTLAVVAALTGAWLLWL